MVHCFINYLQGIQIEENNRYYLFDEKKLQEEYEKKTGEKKTKGCSVTDKPSIYNIEPTIAFNNPLRLIDTAGFGDVRGEDYDKQITKDIQDLFTNEIETLHAICLIFKASETRAHDRAKLVLDKLFSLFGKEIKKNIVIIFTFVDDFNDIPALITLTDEKSPFINILGNINELPHFEFNNKAYFSKDKEGFEGIFNKNASNYGKLLKHVFSLSQISLESSKKVIKNRFDISNKIINVCNELTDVIEKLTASLKNRSFTNELRHKYELQRESPYRQIEVTRQVPEEYTESYKDFLSSGWYVLYCDYCEKICHRDCKGPKEGFHSNEYGCNAIGTFSCSCSNCDCHYSRHTFKNYIMRTRSRTRMKEQKFLEDDPNSIADEEEKKKKREKLEKEIKEREKQLYELDNDIHKSLNDSIDKLSFIASREIELNKIALKKYEDVKYGYSKKILDETIQKKQIKDIFKRTLDDIESICSSIDQREKSINEMQTLLNSSLNN